MFKKYWKRIVAGAALFILTAGLTVGAAILKPESNSGLLGNSASAGERGGTWYVFDKFSGFQTKYDRTKVDDGANTNGQNTTINDGDRISSRNLGYELFPTTATYATTTGGIKSMHTFRKRDGENILMRSYGTVLEYYDENTDTWEIIKSGLTSGQKFGFADYNINTDLRSYVYYGNAKDNFARWDGVHTQLNGAVAIGDSVINVDDAQYFTNTGSVIYCGTTTAYSAKTATSLILSASTTVVCADNAAIASAPTETAGNPKGNIYMTADNRLWIAGVTSTPQAVFFSKYGDATEFTTTTLITDNTDTSSGIFNLGEGGGGVTAMIQDEQAIYLFKRSIIRRATLSDTTYTLSTLKPFDGKSQTVGGTNQGLTFTSGNEVFFTTPDNQIMKLARVENVDYPQINAISDIIKPTIDPASFVDGTGIVYKNKAYFSAKATTDAIANNTIFVFNLQTKTWDSPIIGWSVADWAVYDDGSGEELYFGDALTNNVYKIISEPLDYIYDFAANWRSKEFNFGLPQTQKVIDNVFIEGYISPNTSLTISLLLDEDGYTQTYQTTLLGTETGYIYSSVDYNVFGFEPFGYERFGSNTDQSGKKKFRVYLAKNFTPIPFYNAQIEFASDGQNQSWEIIAWAFNVKSYTQNTKTSLMRIFQ